MPRHLGSVLPSVVAVCTATLFTPAFMTLGNPAHAIGDCVAAPGSSTPQGSHWYYRTDRATQRKCWYLGSQNPTVQDAASRTVPQAPGAADSGTSPIAGDTNEAVTPPPQLEPRQTQAWPTLNSVETSRETAPALQWPNPPAATPQVEEGATNALGGQEHALKNIQESGALPDQPVQQSTLAAGSTGESTTAADFYLVLFFGVLGILGLLARGIVAIAARRRRRTHVHIVDLPNFHLELTAPASGTRFSPLPSIKLIHQQDDVEQALRQLSRTWKRGQRNLPEHFFRLGGNGIATTLSA